MKDELVDKLNDFIGAHMPPNEESHVVYLMVEMRKIIDQSKAGASYPLLKFYADWTVHSSKDRITDEIEAMAKEMYETAVEDIENGWPLDRAGRHPITAFADMDAFGLEVASFLADHQIDPRFAGDQAHWRQFVRVFTKVLENQPIIEPYDNIASIVFEPASERAVLLKLNFKQPIKGKHWYRYGNVR